MPCVFLPLGFSSYHPLHRKSAPFAPPALDRVLRTAQGISPLTSSLPCSAHTAERISSSSVAPNALSLSCTQHVLSSPSCVSLKLVCSWEEPWALQLYFSLFLPPSACALLNTHLNWMLSFWFPVLRSLWILTTRSQAEWTKKKANSGVRLTSSAVTSSVTWSKFHHHSEPQFLLLYPVCL